ncbi:hypothetical protein Misp01_34260 [Microtetraspora sp. NBRC 13810]|uniref:hypothetical protein n=1 Tax=Microtetraspora sp. NBRC 13810 TaxID=3030990 RepID=UPI0024A51261|nr:hypothetical protein [Microtetraspora sp. NBRC 13810]GLW08296.1 hypothetical protein Misp01_34260 [Microtetraspora sp. NBRC 13810]
MALPTAPARRLTVLGVAVAVGATLLSAQPAAAAAPPEGAYWHTRTISTSTHPLRFGTRAHPYSLVQQEIEERWSAPDGRAWVGRRELATLPGTAADRKAWRRDGSPSRWSESIDGKTVKLSAHPAQGRVDPVPGKTQFWFAEQWLTYDEVQRLPADPGRLKDWITKAGRTNRESDIPGWVRYTLPAVLHDVPAPKEVRTAAYRALLTLPGVRAGGAAKDDLGRPGTVVVIDSTSGKGKEATVFKERLIVDTGRMVLLSQDQKATRDGKAVPDMSSDETLIQVGWTDSRPAVPALP